MDPISIEMKKISRWMWEAIEIFDERLQRMKVKVTIDKKPYPIDPSNLFQPGLPNFFDEKRKTLFSFSQDHIIDPGALQDDFRLATHMGASHDHDLSGIPFLNEPRNLECLFMIGGEGGRDSKKICLRFLDPPSDLIPFHPEMVITGIQFKRALIIEGVEVLKVRKLRGNRDGSPLLGLTVEDFNLNPLRSEGRGQIGQPDGLSPNRGLIEIPDGRLNE